MSDRAELYRRLAEHATKEICEWPEWKRASIVMYRETDTYPRSVEALRLHLQPKEKNAEPA